MSPGDKKPSSVVFVGNIPYGLTEEQIIDIFSSVGRVVNFRLVYDKDTGRPKGYGFAEYTDPETAASAVRNLQDYEVMGRNLRVDYSHDGGIEDSAPAGYTPQPQAHNGPSSSSLPPLPPGVDLPPDLQCTDAISRTLSTLPAPQLLDILTQMKGLVMADPNKATQLLTQAPQLSYAIFQALLLLGLVDTTVLSSVIEQSAPAPAPQPAYQAPAAAAPPQVDRAALIQQVLAMTPDQIAALPPMEQNQINLLRQRLLSGQGLNF